jgi:prevent-host-death family protein
MEEAMATVGAFEAKTKFSALLERAERGEQIVITRRGKPVAKLVRIEKRKDQDGDDLLARFKAGRQNATLGGISWKELRDSGRKY